MLTEKDLRSKYQGLPHDKKISVGTALVKVNMGVAQPDDLREVAVFLKGSSYIAKPETLDRLIEFLHSGKVSSKTANDEIPDDEISLLEDPTLEDLESIFSEVTVKEKIDI
jgi:hypothetical protein